MIKDVLLYIRDLLKMVIGYMNTLKSVANIPEGAFVFWAVPEYGNLGDQAITYAELHFIKDTFPKSERYVIPERKCLEYIFAFKRLASEKKFVFVCPGGGNMGEAYPKQEKLRLLLINNININLIISFPQSTDYDLNSKSIHKAKSIYQSNKHLILYARDIESSNKLKKCLPSCDIKLFPDIVAYLDRRKYQDNRSGILMCIRNDKEKNIDCKKILNNLKSVLSEEIEYIDTFDSSYAVEFANQSIKIYEFWETYSKKKLVITDRLHGMIFSYITGTPCLALDNAIGKISSFYNTWFVDCPYIQLFDEESAISFVDSALSGEINYKVNSELLSIVNSFNLMKKDLKKQIEKNNLAEESI